MTAVLERPAAAARATRPGALLATLLIGQFMAILDVSIVNVAAPTIRRDLHASGAGLQMVVGGYLISYAMLLITGARLGDRFGHGRVFRLGLAVFTATSLACGVAPTAASLIVFRFAQGAGAALMMPQLMSLIQRTFSGDARAWALSLYQAVIAGGAVVGQVLGGVLVSADLFGWGWRPVFLVNVPIGLVLLAVAGRYLPAGHGEPGRRLDPAGVAAVSVAVLLLVVPLVLGHQEQWPWWTWASLGASAVAFGVFARIEHAVGRDGGAPLVSGRLLRAPGLVVGALALLLMTLTYGGYLFTMALHLQSGLGESAARAGLTFAPMAVGFAATALTWQRIPARLHPPMLPTALAIAALALVLLAAIVRNGTGGGALLELDLLLVGLAFGLAFSPILNMALRHVPLAEAADASGVLVTVFQLGQVIGVATLGTTYLSLVHAPGAHASAHALAITLIALAGCSVAAAGCAFRLVRARVATR